MKARLLPLASLTLLVAGCSPADEQPESETPRQTQISRPSTSGEPSTEPPVTSQMMPDLIGMPSAEARERLGELDLGSAWGRPIAVHCEVRPRTVLEQRPAAGTPLSPDTIVRVRTGALDLDRFRGPCDTSERLVGEVAQADAALALEFYRFATNPSLGAPFASGDVWVGIEDGLESRSLTGSDIDDLVSWELDTEYAERSGPFSALDTLAGSGGYYQLSDGVAGTCPGGDDKAPPELAGLRAISLTARADVTSACLEWWGVTLFLDPADHIKGVALRLGSP